MHDNFSQRFPSTTFISQIAVLDETNWPDDVLEKTPCGTTEISSVCKTMYFSMKQTADVLNDFAELKKTRKLKPQLAELQRLINVYPVSSAC